MTAGPEPDAPVSAPAAVAPNHVVPYLDDTIIQALYGAASGLVPWTVPLDALRRSLGGQTLHLMVLRRDTGQLVTSAPPLEGREDSMIASPARPPFQSGQAMSAKVAEDERHVAVLTMIEVPEAAAPRVNAQRAFATCASHLTTAFRITQRLRVQGSVAAVGAMLMGASDQPMILLTAHGAIVSINALAREYLSSGADLHEQDGQLCCHDAQVARRLQETLERFVREAPGAASANMCKRVAIRLDAHAKPLVLATLWPLQQSPAIGIFSQAPVALLTIAVPRLREVPRLDPAYLSALFEVTPAEARLINLLLQGATIKEAARLQRISLETVRSHLKSIYAKTDTRRQSQLVELLLRVAIL